MCLVLIFLFGLVFLSSESPLFPLDSWIPSLLCPLPFLVPSCPSLPPLEAVVILLWGIRDGALPGNDRVLVLAGLTAATEGDFIQASDFQCLDTNQTFTNGREMRTLRNRSACLMELNFLNCLRYLPSPDFSSACTVGYLCSQCPVEATDTCMVGQYRVIA